MSYTISIVSNVETAPDVSLEADTIERAQELVNGLTAMYLDLGVTGGRMGDWRNVVLYWGEGRQLAITTTRTRPNAQAAVAQATALANREAAR